MSATSHSRASAPWRRTAVLLLCLGFCTAAESARAWWNCSWESRVALQVGNTGAAQSNALVEVVLGPAQLPGFNWAAPAASVRVLDSDDATLVPHFIEPHPAGLQRLHLWFRVASLPAAGKRVFLYYGNPAATSTSDASILTATGVRFLTRRQSIDPTSLAGFFGEFDSASRPTGYGCAVLPDHVGRSNANVFGSGVNAHYSVLFVLDVPPAQAGTWELRFGADFGFGGGAYARGVVLEEQWNDDLWWAGNFAAAGEVLQGSVMLSAGRHLLAVYGSEGCCEGASTLQLRPPGGAWTDLRASNFAITAPICPLPGVATARVADVAGLVVGKTSAAQSDPFNGTTNPTAIPGARVRYTIRVGNGDAAQIIDSNSIVVVDPVPAGTSLYVNDIAGPGSGPVRFVDSSPASGLSYVYSGLGSATDSLAFSNDGGITFSYTPTPDANGVDTAVTHIRATASGRPSCNATPTVRSFELQFDVRVR
jgi:hypothetical protein